MIHRKTPRKVPSVKFAFAKRSADADKLAKFFRDNLTAEYISHGELQSYRALRPARWSPNIEQILRDEVITRLSTHSKARLKDTEWRGVVTGTAKGQLVALAFVSINRRAAVPYGVLEDIVIDSARRDGGFGTRIIRWIISDFKAAKIDRVFLESGIANEKAHHLFERLKFKPLSVVMMRDL